MFRRCVQDAQKIHEKGHKCEKMRRDASEIRMLVFDFVPMKDPAMPPHDDDKKKDGKPPSDDEGGPPGNANFAVELIQVGFVGSAAGPSSSVVSIRSVFFPS